MAAVAPGVPPSTKGGARACYPICLSSEQSFSRSPFVVNVAGCTWSRGHPWSGPERRMGTEPWAGRGGVCQAPGTPWHSWSVLILQGFVSMPCCPCSTLGAHSEPPGIPLGLLHPLDAQSRSPHMSEQQGATSLGEVVVFTQVVHFSVTFARQTCKIAFPPSHQNGHIQRAFQSLPSSLPTQHVCSRPSAHTGEGRCLWWEE